MEGNSLIDLVNKQVMHGKFGKGSIVSYNDSIIKIRFNFGKKKFIFPDAFENYLTIFDQRAANMLKRKIQKKEIEREKKEKRLKKEKALQQVLRRQESLKSGKSHSRLQSVFWCSPEEEDKIFNEWSVFTGAIESGLKKGQPRRLVRMNQGSACLLTTRKAGMAEKHRYIMGVFMVEDGFSGRNCKDGNIPAHPEYRIRLSEEERGKMLFWNYYVNSRYPNNMVWNSGRQRYFENVWMAQILRDIVSLKSDPKEKKYVNGFFEYFCQINNINKDGLPRPNGALI